ncbi:MAG: SH3 domain-containing protein [candidate division KSB1 bacterium]
MLERTATLFFLAAMLWSSPGFAQIAVLKDEAAPLYEKPSLQSKLIGVLAAGDTVRILQTRSGWVQLNARKQQGWMRAGAKAAAHFSPLPKIRSAKNFPPTTAPYDGGVVLGLGTLGGDFAYIGRFYYRNLPRWELEGSFEYVAGQIASIYLMHVNPRYVRPIKSRFDGYLTAGVGVINTVPIQSAGGKTISNMALNYGLGVQRRLNNKNWLRADLRQFTAIRQQGSLNFLEFTVGLGIGMRWAKL